MFHKNHLLSLKTTFFSTLSKKNLMMMKIVRVKVKRDRANNPTNNCSSRMFTPSAKSIVYELNKEIDPPNDAKNNSKEMMQTAKVTFFSRMICFTSSHELHTFDF